jgi:mRNA interferase RelE/StbE
MLKIDLSKRAHKFLEKLPAKQARQLTAKILSLRNNPKPQDSNKLKGYDHYLRADFGEYRITYYVNVDVLVIVLVGKRNDDEVYKQLKRT